jgi:ABC-type multidrug transport system ATPase subunit
MDPLLAFKGLSVDVPCQTTWTDRLWASVLGQLTTKAALQNLSGEFKTGGLVAIMGSSGAGKSTFLHALAHRLTHATELRGDVLFRGARLKPSHFRKQTALVPQDSALLSTLTPRESILCSAQLCLPPEMPSARKKERVQQILDQLGLTKCADTLVGNTLTRGISGGERKRTSIAIELVSNPDILFVDEPTSGLDAATSLIVMQKLKELVVDRKRLILVTIHQPSAEIFQLFDELILLSLGQILYFGPTARTTFFFERLGYICPRDMILPEFFVDVIGTADEITRRQFQDQLLHFPDIHESVSRSSRPPRSSSHQVEGQKDSERSSSSEDSLPSRSPETKGGHRFRSQERPMVPAQVQSHAQFPQVETKKVGWFHQFYVLFIRAVLTYFRTPFLTYAKVGLVVLLGVLSGATFFGLGGNDQKSVQNRFGAIYFIVISVVFGNSLAVVLTFPNERSVFLREQSNHLYSVSAYFIGKSSLDLPVESLVVLLYAAIAYNFIGFSPSQEQFGHFAGILILVAYAGQSLGLLIGSMVSSQSLAALLAPLSLAPFILFTPYAISSSAIPSYLTWIKSVSVFWWAFDALSINEFSHLKLRCTQDQFFVTTPARQDQDVAEVVCRWPLGTSVLTQYGIEPSLYWLDILMLVVIAVLFRLFALVALKLLSMRLRPMVPSVNSL